MAVVAIEMTTPVGPVRLICAQRKTGSAPIVTQGIRRLGNALLVHKLCTAVRYDVILAEPPYTPTFADEFRWADLIYDRLCSVCQDPTRCPHAPRLPSTFEDPADIAMVERYKNTPRRSPTKRELTAWVASEDGRIMA